MGMAGVGRSLQRIFSIWKAAKRSKWRSSDLPISKRFAKFTREFHKNYCSDRLVEEESGRKFDLPKSEPNSSYAPASVTSSVKNSEGNSASIHTGRSAASLRAAALELIRDKSKGHHEPYYWAAFTLTGDFR